MNSRPRHITLLFTLVALLLAAMPALAHASPDGDDDPTYNAGSAFGTQYSSLFTDREGELEQPRPVTDQDPGDGSSVTAVVMYYDNEVGEGYFLRLTRFDVNGQPTGFGGDGISEQDLPDRQEIDELLDIRVLSDGTFWVLARSENGEELLRYHFKADGTFTDSDSVVVSELPGDCQYDDWITRDTYDYEYYDGYIVAARVKADGGVAALWDCIPYSNGTLKVIGGGSDNDVYVTAYEATDGVEYASRALPDEVSYGEDLEFGPNGDPYALVGTYPEEDPVEEVEDRIGENGTSQVFHVNDDADLTLADPTGGSVPIDGLPVDLAVDSQARPLVWTQPQLARADDGNNHWNIWRLTAATLELDTGWGSGGEAVISDPRLAHAFGGVLYWQEKRNFLTVRPGDKVLATGGYQPQDLGGGAPTATTTA